MTTKTKAAPKTADVDLLADRPLWQREDFLPALPTIRWERLDDARDRHVAAVAYLRAALEAGDQAAEDAALATVGDLVLEVCPALWQHFPSEGEDAFQAAAAAVTPTAAEPDGWAPIAPVSATPDGDRTSVIDAVNAKAETGDESYRSEVERLADARRAFEQETQTWRGLYRRLEPVFLRGLGAVCADVMAVERHCGARPEDERS